MSSALFRRLAEPTLVALRLDGAEWPRGLLSESPIPDAWVGLVQTRDGRRRFAPAGEDPRPQPGDRLILIRSRLIAVPLGVGDTAAQCGNMVHASGELLLRWPPREANLAALGEALLADPELSSERLADALADGGGLSALRAFIRSHDAEALVGHDVRDELLAALRQACERFGFESGCEIERVTRAEFGSKTLAQQQARRRAAQRDLQEIEARQTLEQAARAATHRRLDDLSGLLDKLRNAAAAGGGEHWRTLLPALSPAERGRLLENLWRITPDRRVAKAIVLAAGNELLWLDPHAPDKPTNRVTLPPDLGGLRSLAHDAANGWLLVGAATGVWAVRSDDGAVVCRYAVPECEPQRTGFNAVALAAGKLYATHSKLGLWHWIAGEPASGQPLFEPDGGTPAAVRAVTLGDDGRVWFSADDCVQVYDPATGELSVFTAAHGVIHSLALAGGDLYVGVEDGRLIRFALDNPDYADVLYRGSGPLESIDVRRWDDLIELVVPGGANGVCGVYRSESFTAQLLRSPAPIRRAWACDDCIVGLSERRDRLVVAHADAGRAGVELNLARLCGASVQDVCVIVSDAAAMQGAGDANRSDHESS